MGGKIIVNANAYIMAMAISRAQQSVAPFREDFLPESNSKFTHRRGKFKQNNRKSKKG